MAQRERERESVSVALAVQEENGGCLCQYEKNEIDALREGWEMIVNPFFYTKESPMLKMKVATIFAEMVSHVSMTDTEHLMMYFCGLRYGNFFSGGIIRHEKEIVNYFAGTREIFRRMDHTKLDDRVAKDFSMFILRNIDDEEKICDTIGLPMLKVKAITILYRMLFSKLREPFKDY